MEWKKYRKRGYNEMRPYIVGNDPTMIVGKQGDMIARDPNNHEDQWLVAEEYFKANYESFE